MPGDTPELPVGRAVTVDVPASTANLGPGFDTVGLALDWWDRYRVEITPSGVQVAVPGAGADSVPDGEQNLVVRSVRHGLDQLGFQVPGLRLTGEHTIPQGRGLGSSAAATVAGLAAAQLLATGETCDASGRRGLDPIRWLIPAAAIEGHPDNVAAALAGGLVLVYGGTAGLRLAQPAVHPGIAALAFVPDEPLSTEQARGLLPATVDHAEAATHGARAALLVHALTAEPSLLYEATRDGLHQPHRARAMPASADLLDSLRARGVPAVLSGAGPTVLVLGQAGDLDPVAAADAPGFRAVRLGIGTGVSGMCGAR